MIPQRTFFLIPIFLLLGNVASGFPIQDNEELVYFYNSRVLTGLAKTVQQFSGFATRGKLIVRSKGNGILMKLTDIEVGTFNDELKQDFLEEVKFVFEKPEGPLVEFIKDVENPIHVTLEKGLVKSFDAMVDDPFWSINFKKALLALFQVDLQGPKDAHHSDFYKVTEDSINGKCQTQYEITETPSSKDPTKKILHVTKQRFLDHCDDLPKQQFCNLWGWSCSHQNSQHQKATPMLNYPVQKSSVVAYVIGEDGFPTNINGLNFITAAPYGSQGESPLSGVNQTLSLIEKRAMSDENMDLKGETVSYKSLRYIFHDATRNTEADSKKGHHYNRLAAIFIPDYFQQAHNLFEDILNESMLDEKQKEILANKNTIKLVRMFSAFSFDDFQKFFDEFISTIEEKNMKTTKRKLFTDILPIVGTTPAALFIIHLSKSQDLILETEKHSMLIKLPFYVKEPTVKLVEEYKELAKTPFFLSKYRAMTQMEESEELLSALGTILFRGCTLKSPGVESSKPFISEEDCSSQLQHLFDEFHKTKTARGQITYVKAIINTRLPETRKFLLNIIEGNYPGIVRRFSIWGVMHTLSDDNNEILRVLLKITRNFNEDYVTRIFAYEVILFISPDPSFTTRIMFQMMRDPSKHLVSYLYHSMSNYANASSTCFQSFSKQTKFVLQFLKPPEESGIFYSGFKTLDYYNEQYQIGRTSQYLWVGNDRGILPREIYTHQGLDVFNSMMSIIEAGISSEMDFNLDDLVTTGFFSTPNPKLEDFKLPFVPRKPMKSPFLLFEKMDMYLKSFNQFVRGYETLESLLENAYNPVQWKAEEKFLLKSILIFGDYNQDIPNDAGFPFSIDSKSVASTTVAGISHAELQATDTENYYVKLMKFFSNIELNAIDGFALDHSISAITPSGYAFGFGLTTEGTSKYVLRGGIEPNMAEKSLTIRYKPSNEPYEIFRFKTQPFTFIYQLSNLSPDFKKDPIVLIRNAKEPTVKTYNLDPNYFGVGLKTTFKYDYFWNDFGSYRSFVKSFFKKQKTYEDYHYWNDRLNAGLRGLMDYAAMNPNLRPFEMNVDYQPSVDHPVEEFIFKMKYEGTVSTPSSQSENDGKLLDLDDLPDEHICDLKISLTAKGKVDREWKAHCRMTTLWPTNQLKDCSIDFERTPLPGFDEKPFKFCFKREGTYPKFLKLIENSLENFKVERKATLNFGESCEEGNEIHLKATFEKSDEQRHLFETPEVRELFDKCKKAVIRKEYNSKCWKDATDLFSLRKGSLDIDFKKSTPLMKNVVQRITAFVRHYLYDKMELNQLNVVNPENHIHIEANVSQYPVADINIYKPNENIFYRKLYIPAVIPRYQPFSIIEDAKERFLYNLFHYRPYASCVINKEKLQSFDGLENIVSWTDCYHIVARECQGLGGFTVLAKHVNHPKFFMSIKIFLGNEILAEIKPDAEKDDALILIPFEGEAVDLRYHSLESKNKGQSRFRFYYYLDQYVVEGENFGRFRVRFDGNEINVEVPYYYKGATCGLCGNFDLDTKNEWEGPDKCVYQDPASFSYSYAIPEEGCTVPQFQCPK